MTAPVTSWDDVPLVVRTVERVAPLLGRSPRSIKRALADGTMNPPPLPRVGGEAWAWSKTALMRWHDGGSRPTHFRRAS